MEEIEKIGIKEFRKSLSKYLQGSSPIEVMRHGHTLGYYFPVRQESKLAEVKALRSVAQQCQQILKKQGISEEDLVEELRQMQMGDKKRL